jgi:hypothetical protein
MTYNFDPERWYENELAALDAAHDAGRITRGQYEAELQRLDDKLEGMWQRLDGSYRVTRD